MAFGQLSLKGRALQLLARREHSRAELERKLAPYAQEPGELKKALDELQDKGFIDEQRVLDSVVHRRASRLGAARIKTELLAKGIDAERVTAAVAQLRTTELDRAREIWRKKFGSPAQDATHYAKQARFLAARGFSGDVISRVLRDSSAEELIPPPE